jgi:hypothetical protein
MLTVAAMGRIRGESALKVKTIKQTDRYLKASRNMVCMVLRSGETAFEFERDIQRRPKLGGGQQSLTSCWQATQPSRSINQQFHDAGFRNFVVDITTVLTENLRQFRAAKCRI